MPLTQREGLELGTNIIHIWHDVINSNRMRQLDNVMNNYIDDRIIAYFLQEDENTQGIRIVKLENFKKSRQTILKPKGETL